MNDKNEKVSDLKGQRGKDYIKKNNKQQRSEAMLYFQLLLRLVNVPSRGNGKGQEKKLFVCEKIVKVKKVTKYHMEKMES